MKVRLIYNRIFSNGNFREPEKQKIISKIASTIIEFPCFPFVGMNVDLKTFISDFNFDENEIKYINEIEWEVFKITSQTIEKNCVKITLAL